jgi:MSHA biogenesis protein MshN
MSVINQVLNQLEQRGEHTPPEQEMVRPVHRDRRSFILPLLALLLALAGGVAAWQWIEARKPVLSPVEGPALSSVEGTGAVAAHAIQQQPVAVAPLPAPAPAVTTLAPAPVPQAPAVLVSAGAYAAADAGETPPVAILPPASRLSFELSAIPLPSSLRQVPPGAKAAADGGEKPPPPAAPPPVRAPDVRGAVQPSGGMPLKRVSPEQRADAEFRQAVAAMQQGHIADAIAGYRVVLRLDAGHDEARQALAALLLESKQGAEAERVLQERLNARPGHTGFAMMLARLQVEHGALEAALATLEKSLPYADAQADYQAFFAALLQRRNRHKEAITHYQIALQLAPDNGVWLMGYGLSLQAVQRATDAGSAFRRALESGTLTPELQAFIRQKLKEL